MRPRWAASCAQRVPVSGPQTHVAGMAVAASVPVHVAEIGFPPPGQNWARSSVAPVERCALECHDSA